ncbi:DNA repair protein RAD52 homolog [Anabrus simplex]|uniref:DNA repair protein RAD52 homolog n=1 Tax=Anabrus simplex TaxID=316456 RepID=UPI0034DD0A13
MLTKWKSEAVKQQNISFTEEEDLGFTAQEYEEFYLQEHQHLINSANKKFGADCWSHSITRQEIDCVDAIQGKYDVGISAFVRVELKTGKYHEGLGYGICCGKKSKPLSILIARKEAILKGLRAALQCFFDVPARTPSEIPASKDTELDGRVPRMIVSKSGLDEVDMETSVTERKLQTSPGVKPIYNDNSVFWKKAKLSSDPAPQKMEVTTNINIKPAVCNSFNTPSHSNTAIGDDVIEDEERKLERKRKQRQKQEEFRRKQLQKQEELRQNFKQIQPENSAGQNSMPGERANKMDELIGNLDAAEPSFISTQELNEMIQTTTVHSKTNGPLRRVPLLSSPPKDWRTGSGLPV